MKIAIPSLRTQGLIISLLAFILYFNTVFNDYALDDGIVILENTYTKMGIGGIGKLLTRDSFEGFLGKENTLLAGGRYRPLSLVSFALEYSFWGANPMMSHLVNALLFAITAWVLLQFLHLYGLKNNPTAAFFASLLFVIHPIHTEAVANIKGRDELLSLLFILLSFLYYFHYNYNKQLKYIIGTSIFFFLALLSKENGLVMPLLIFLASIALIKEKKITHHLAHLVPFIGVIGLYAAMRISATGLALSGSSTDVLNQPYFQVDSATRFATIFYVLGYYIKLLIVPFPLSFDYSFQQIPYQSWGAPFVWLACIVYLSLIGIGIWLNLIKRNIIGFWLLFFPISLVLVSNIFVNVGAFMGERFLYQPSIAFCVFGGLGLAYLYEKQNALALLLAGIVSSAGGSATILRNMDWENNETLYLTDVKAVPNSAKANKAAAESYLKMARQNEALAPKYLPLARTYLQKALSLHPQYVDAYLDLGTAYYLEEKFDSTELVWAKAAAIEPDRQMLKENYNILAQKYLQTGLSLAKAKQIPEATRALKKALTIKPNDDAILYNLGLLYGEVGRQPNAAPALLDTAIIYIEQAVKRNPNAPDYYYNLGGAYFTQKNYALAQAAWEKTVSLNPNHQGAKGGLNALKGLKQ